MMQITLAVSPHKKLGFDDFQTHIFRTLDAFNDDTMRTTYIAAALILAFANPVTATYNYIAGYEPGSDVDKHNMIDLDVRDIQAGLPKTNGGVLNACADNLCKWDKTNEMYPAAWDTACVHSDTSDPVVPNSTAECQTPFGIWNKGKNSLKSDAVRSIGAGFAGGIGSKRSEKGNAKVPFGTSAANNPFISTMNSYWQSKGLDASTWGLDIIEAAFKGDTIPGSTFNFGSVGMDFRKEVIQKGIVYLNIFPYVIWEMQDAINDCIDGQLTANDGTAGGNSVHAWDEAVAFYTGSAEGKLKGGNNGLKSCSDDKCYLQFMLADKRCKNFGTCTADNDGNAFSGYSKANEEIFALFQQGEREIIQAQSSNSATKCALPQITMEKVTTKMLVPYIQGVMRYLYKTKDQAGRSAKQVGELFAFASAALPFINAVDPAAAMMLYKRAWDLDFDTYTYEETKNAIEATYPKLGHGEGIGTITCVDIGHLHDSAPSLIAAGCYDPVPADDEEDNSLAIALGVTFGLLALAAIVFAIWAAKKERKTRLMYENILHKVPAV